MMNFVLQGASSPFPPFPIRRACWRLSRKSRSDLQPPPRPTKSTSRWRLHSDRTSRHAWSSVDCEAANPHVATAPRTDHGIASDAAVRSPTRSSKAPGHRRSA